MRERTILDPVIDGMDRAELARVNWRFRLGIELRWWWSTDRLRVLVREGMTKKLAASTSPDGIRQLLERS